MTFKELVEKLQDTFEEADAEEIVGHLAIQFDITGEADGTMYLEVKDGEIVIAPFDYYDKDALVITTAKVLSELVSGKLDLTEAFLTGKLTIEGDLTKVADLKKIRLKSQMK